MRNPFRKAKPDAAPDPEPVVEPVAPATLEAVPDVPDEPVHKVFTPELADTTGRAVFVDGRRVDHCRAFSTHDGWADCYRVGTDGMPTNVLARHRGRVSLVFASEAKT